MIMQVYWTVCKANLSYGEPQTKPHFDPPLDPRESWAMAAIFGALTIGFSGNT
jgi:hypothetical protein